MLLKDLVEKTNMKKLHLANQWGIRTPQRFSEILNGRSRPTHKETLLLRQGLLTYFSATEVENAIIQLENMTRKNRRFDHWTEIASIP